MGVMGSLRACEPLMGQEPTILVPLEAEELVRTKDPVAVSKRVEEVRKAHKRMHRSCR